MKLSRSHCITCGTGRWGGLADEGAADEPLQGCGQAFADRQSDRAAFPHELRMEYQAQWLSTGPKGLGCETVLPSVICNAHLMASKYILRTSGSSQDSSVWPRVE